MYIRTKAYTWFPDEVPESLIGAVDDCGEDIIGAILLHREHFQPGQSKSLSPYLFIPFQQREGGGRYFGIKLLTNNFIFLFFKCKLTYFKYYKITINIIYINPPPLCRTEIS